MPANITSDLSTKSEELKLKSQSLSTIEQSGRQTQDGLKREFEELKLRSEFIYTILSTARKSQCTSQTPQELYLYNTLKHLNFTGKELDAEITNKTSYLAECAQSVGEYNQLKRVLEEKEAALKVSVPHNNPKYIKYPSIYQLSIFTVLSLPQDSAAEISSFKDKVNVLVKEEREEGEKSAHWKTQVKF